MNDNESIEKLAAACNLLVDAVGNDREKRKRSKPMFIVLSSICILACIVMAGILYAQSSRVSQLETKLESIEDRLEHTEKVISEGVVVEETTTTTETVTQTVEGDTATINNNNGGTWTQNGGDE